MSERYLANENFPAWIVHFLRTHGDDVLYAAESLVAASDEVVLREAVNQARVLLTFDRDFGELVFRRRQPPAPGIVLFRLGGQSPDGLLSFLQAFFASQPKLRGFFTVASPGHFRQVRLGEPQEETV
jgi:predicted nuclease of predicted toxin-antitoxin system